MNNDEWHSSECRLKGEIEDLARHGGDGGASDPSDDNCMELLDKLTCDDSGPCLGPVASAAVAETLADARSDDKFSEDIIDALKKKDIDRILALVISQSQNGDKMSCLPTEAIQEIEKSSSMKQGDPKTVEKLNNWLRSQPKSFATAPLRATVAPIRNESIVSSSSSNMSSNTGFRSNKTIKTETPLPSTSSSSSSVSSVPSSLLPADDFLSLISSTDCKPPSGGTRSHPATPPVSQIPNRPLSSHCVPIRSNEQRKRSETDLDPISYCNYSNQGPPLQQQSMQYLPLNMSQFTQYPSPIMAAQNFYLMPMMNPNDTTGGATGSIMPQPSPIMSQAGSTATQSHPNNQISFLLGSTALFSVPGSNNTSNTVPNTPINQSGQSVTTGDIIRACNQSISVASISHGGSTGTGGTGSNLPKILPKPQPTIMPRMMQHGHGGGTGSIMINHNHHHQLIQSQLSANANNNTMGISSNQLQHQSQQSSQQQIQQQFKRPSNRKSGIKSGSRSSSTSSSSGSGSVSIKSAVKRAPDPPQPIIHHLNQSSTISKDTVAVAWEIAEQSVPTDDLLQSSSSSSCSSSFVTDLTNSNTVGEFSSFLSQSEPFDEFLDDFVNVNSVVPIDSVSPPPKFAQMIVMQYEFECLASLPQIIEPCRRSAVVQTVSRPVPATVTVIRQPITGSSCLVIARQQPLVSVPPLFDIDLDQLLSISSATAAHNNGLESQRVVQLLLNSQFNRGLLKYLLPSSTHPPSHSSPITTVGPIISSKHSHNSHHNNTNQGPLSVCTEHDELIEDDLLADISPVKRDPSHLANLDRFLESCQSISPISGSIMMDPDDGKIDSNTCIRTATGADNDRVNRKSTPIIIDDYLPFQRRSIQSSSSVNLSDYSSINGDIVWLKKAKQRNKWIHNGTHIRSSKALEIPQKHSCLSSNSVSQVDRFLKKKSSYRQSGLNSTKIGVATLAPNKSKHKEKHHRKSNKTRRKSVSLNSSDSQTKTRSHNQWGLLKMKINLSELKIVESTINKSVIDNSSDHSGKIIPQQQTILSIIPPVPLPPVVTAPAQAQIYQPPIKNSSNTCSNNNPKRIFCTRKEDRRSSALSNASPTKVPRKSALASPVGGKNHRRQKAAHTDEHPPLILKLSTKLINNEEEDEEEDEEEEEEPEEEEDDDDEEEEEEPEEDVPVIQEQHHQPKATAAATTSGNLKLRLKYFSRESSWTKLNNGGINNSNRSTIIEQSPVPVPVSIPPPPLAISMRSRPQLLEALQFSPTHSSSDSEIDQSSHLEISCLLRRQEQRDPLSLTTSSTDHHQSINSSSCNNSSNQSQINTHNNLLGNNNSGGQSNAKNHNNNNNSASSRLSSQSHLPVPYLVGSDPSVFIDPHEFDLVVVKNSRYKRLITSTSNNTFITNNQSVSSSGISQQLSSGPPITSTPPQPAAIGSQNPPRPPSSSIISSAPQQLSVSASVSAVTPSIQSSIIDVGSELFVPGCFIERPDNKHGLGFSSHMSSGWSSSNNNRSSPSMPVLAPQEPFSSAGSLPGNSGASASASASSGKHDMNIHGIKSSIASRTSMLYEYGNPSQPSQSYSDPSDRLQQSPLCMTTTNTGGNPSQASQYSNSSSQAATEMRPDSSIKSPFHHQSSYYQQGYGSSCYMSDNSVSATASNNQSKTPHHSSPGIAAAITTCSSHIIQDYQPYFQNASHIQPLPSSDTTSFSSISLTSSYQPISDHQSSKHSNSKRSSSSRSHQSEQTSSKKRKESQPSLQLSGYPNADIYNAAAAAQYSSNIDYYSSGFSDIIGGIDRVKLYEQWTRECSQLGQIYPPNIPWNTAMAEYCKQVSSSLIPQSANSTSSSGFGLGNSNPLSLTSNLHGADYPNDISHSVESLKPYLDPYTAYAMTQPYMYSAFGLPK